MSSLRRSNTMQTLKRSNTMQTLKRAGTGAWRWINAEDANISQNHPQGVSYFQRSNTYKRLNSSNSMRRRPSRKQSQFSPQSYSSSNGYPNSYAVDVNNGYKYPNQANSSYQYPNQANTSYQSNSSYQYPNQANNSYQYPNQSNSYKYQSQSNSYKYPNQSNSHNGIKRPEPAAEKYQKETDMNKRKKDSKIPSVLYDPEVRKQLEQLKEHKPYFMYIMTFLQIFFLILTFYKSYTVTHRFIEPISDNPMIGPSSGALITMGARFLPCMKNTEFVNITAMQCPPGIKGKVNVLNPKICALADYCSFGMKYGEVPNQWYRFIIPLVLHGGIAHIFFNLTFQVRTGVQMEKDFGTWRILIIYLASGIFGFAFEATSMPTSPSVGCSGALYGLMACLFIDLIQSWKLIIKPWSELFKMLVVILFSLGIGLLPYIDNYAHFGGFIMGILTGLIFLPSIIFSKRDLRIKRIMMIISIFLSVGLFVWVFRQFYVSASQCKWCKYLNCLPIGDWCENNNLQSNNNSNSTATTHH